MHINKPKWPSLQKQCLFVHLSLLFFELLQRAPFLIISFIFHCLLSDYLVSHVIKTTAEKPVSGERCLIRSRCSGGEKAEALKAFMSQISLCYCYKNKTQKTSKLKTNSQRLPILSLYMCMKSSIQLIPLSQDQKDFL